MPELIGPVLTHLHDTLQDGVRMGFMHSSRSRGRTPNGLKEASQVRFVGHSGTGDGTTLLRFEVASFGSVAGELFEQQLLWEDGPQPEQTAFELLGAALADMRQRRSESNRFDLGMLSRIGGYRRMLKRGITRIGLPDTALPDAGQIDANTVEAASELSAATPASRRVRVAGRLDLMGASQSVLKLDVKSGTAITAVWEGLLPVENLKDFFNRDVVLEGTGVFRPSGTLLRVDADAIAYATAQDEFFRQIPEGLSMRDHQAVMRVRSGETSPFSRILGAIPSEESDEEFAAAIEALS